MIVNTNADCKISNIKISGNKAYISLIISSMLETIPTRMLGAYIQDYDSKGKTTLARINNVNYWIDRTNNYDNDSLNVDINFYKEIVLEVDITNYNTANIKENRWVRYCSIQLIDLTTSVLAVVWASSKLTLVSKEIEKPKIQNFFTVTSKDYTSTVYFKFNYATQEDFHYSNDNLIVELNVRSNNTNQILESAILPIANETPIAFKHTLLTQYTDYILLELILRTTNGDAVSRYTKLYLPQPSNLKLFTRYNGVVYLIKGLTFRK